MDVVVFGAGGFGREVAWLISEINRVEKRFDLLGFVDDNPAIKGQVLNGYPVLGGMEYLKDKPGLGVVLALGDPAVRLKVYKKLETLNLEYPNVIHPNVLIGDEVTTGMGNVICAGCILTVNIRMGDFCQLNLKTTVGHDAVLEDFTTTACSVDLAGYSHAGFGTYFGNHSTVLQSVRVGEFTTVGAGAVVNRDLPDGVVAVGVPAKIVRRVGGRE